MKTPKRMQWHFYARPVTGLTDAKKKAKEMHIYSFEYQEWIYEAQDWRTIKEVELPEFRCSFCKADIYPSDKDALTWQGHVYCAPACARRANPGTWPPATATWTKQPEQEKETE